jgi:hypothetical protein
MVRTTAWRTRHDEWLSNLVNRLGTAALNAAKVGDERKN